MYDRAIDVKDCMETFYYPSGKILSSSKKIGWKITLKWKITLNPIFKKQKNFMIKILDLAYTQCYSVTVD